MANPWVSKAPYDQPSITPFNPGQQLAAPTTAPQYQQPQQTQLPQYPSARLNMPQPIQYKQPSAYRPYGSGGGYGGGMGGYGTAPSAPGGGPSGAEMGAMVKGATGNVGPAQFGAMMALQRARDRGDQLRPDQLATLQYWENTQGGGTPGAGGGGAGGGGAGGGVGGSLGGNLDAMSRMGKGLMDPGSDYYKRLSQSMQQQIGAQSAAQQRAQALRGAWSGLGAGASPEQMASSAQIGQAGLEAQGRAEAGLALQAPQLGMQALGSTFSPYVNIEQLGEQSRQFGAGLANQQGQFGANLGLQQQQAGVNAAMQQQQLAAQQAWQQAQMQQQAQQQQQQQLMQQYAMMYGMF